MHAWVLTTPPGCGTLAITRTALLSSAKADTVDSRIGRFRSSMPCLHMYLSTLQVRLCSRPRMTRIQDGWLFLS
jgi:hypothetical protein